MLCMCVQLDGGGTAKGAAYGPWPILLSVLNRIVYKLMTFKYKCHILLLNRELHVSRQGRITVALKMLPTHNVVAVTVCCLCVPIR